MGKNIEIKARCTNLKNVEEMIYKMNIPFEGAEQQSDTFFNVPAGRLKLREYGNRPPILIPYFRPDEQSAKASEYALLKVENADEACNLLERMLGIRAVVEKNRRIYHYENVRIHLDTVTGLGTFIELEGVVGPSEDEEETLQRVELLMEIFEIKEADLITVAYVDLLEKEKKG